MAFYQQVKPKKMSRADHLRMDSKWEEEGTRYRRTTTRNEEKSR